MHRGWKIALGALAAAMIIWAGMTHIVRTFVFRNHAQIASPVWTGTPPREVTALADGGLTLHGYYWPASGAKDVLVVFHGNAGTQQGIAQAALPLTRSGHGVLIASYRGYGGNPGSPTEAGLITDGEAWAALARKILPPGGKLYLLGISLGSGVALEIAARHPVDGVATLGAYTRIADMAPWYARPFVLDRFDNMGAIRRVSAPIVLFHGDRDATIPFECAPRLRDASGGRAVLVRLEGAGHSVPFETLGPMLWKAFGR